MSNSLYHSGIIGQRKGHRHYQYEDGSYTPEGLERYREMRRQRDGYYDRHYASSGKYKPNYKESNSEKSKSNSKNSNSNKRPNETSNSYKNQDNSNKREYRDKDAPSNMYDARARQYKSGSEAFNTASRVVRKDEAFKKEKVTSKMNLDELSDRDLKQYVDRKKLEMEYKSIMYDEINAGKRSTADVLEKVGSIVAIGAGIASIASIAYQMKNSKQK